MRCVSCQSIRHLLQKCLDSYKNLKKFYNTVLAMTLEDGNLEESYITNNLDEYVMKLEQENEIDNVSLFTRDKQKITGLSREMLGLILLDCGCLVNLAGERWWNNYYAALSQELKYKVQVLESDGKKFRFGRGEVLPSILNVKFPGKLAGKDMMFTSHVVKSNIPLLRSRPAMS